MRWPLSSLRTFVDKRPGASVTLDDEIEAELAPVIPLIR
jgi:hypothetical protein